ncbi:PP2C family protein-serine/threonine phosphatase [Paenibacillus thermotolerans]|uniref:PP2C family protein-serine/threonine phosphatase n=1 Tax=Paenibacillus thermotolerans TaxID=3027807 RepID=UPI0023677041|nr:MULTISPECIES: SpoIIE family protein phosphatase [unclassified Paenibacillus]
MPKFKTRLLFRFAMIFTLAAAVGTLMLTINNMFLHGSSLAGLLRFNIPAILAGDFIILILLLLYASYQLRRIKDKRDLQARFIRLPAQSFGALIVISVVFSCIFHYLQYSFYGIALSDLTPRDLELLAKSFVAEISIALVIGTLQYALFRRAARPFLVELAISELPASSRGFVIRPLLVASLSLFFIAGSMSMEYLVLSREDSIGLEALFVVAGMRCLFGGLIFYLLIKEIQGDLRTLFSGIRGLLEGEKKALHNPIPVFSSDELGRLTEQFNRLQTKIANGYREMEQELQLAYNVQQKLLPRTYRLHGDLEAAAVSLPSKEVGGDLYDIVDLNEGGIAVMVGDVSGKGIPAAMLMSASIALFRTELRRGGTPGEVLTRMNGILTETLQGTMMYVTMSIGIWHPASASWQYASAGHVAPYRLTEGGRLEQLPVASLPLGIDPDEEYRDQACVLQAGDRLLMYSDGIMETTAANGELIGFEGFERELVALPSDVDVREQLSQLMNRLKGQADSKYDDDRTIVLVRYASGAASRSKLTDRPFAEAAAGR